MEHAGTGPSLGIRSTELVEVASWPGPFLNILLDTRGAVENASQLSETRWKAHRERLEEAGADQGCLGMVDELVPRAYLEGDALMVIAAPEGRIHVEHDAEPPGRERGEWCAVPSLATLVAWRQRSLPYLLVLIDHKGADLVAVVHRQPFDPVEAGVRDYPLTKAAPGGWSQRRYQQRAENTWRDNARDTARVATRIAERIGAEFVLVAGDDRACHMLLGDLPPALGIRAHIIPGGRASDGSDARLHAEVARQVRSASAQRTAAVLEEFKMAHGQANRAADGPRSTVAALAEARVETLLVHDDERDERTAWIGAAPGEVGLEESELLDLGAEQRAQGRLIDVAVVEALRSGAGVHVVPAHGGPTDGLGATLRWGE